LGWICLPFAFILIPLGPFYVFFGHLHHFPLQFHQFRVMFHQGSRQLIHHHPMLERLGKLAQRVSQAIKQTSLKTVGLLL
jgi:hypothetical protein